MEFTQSQENQLMFDNSFKHRNLGNLPLRFTFPRLLCLASKLQQPRADSGKVQQLCQSWGRTARQGAGTVSVTLFSAAGKRNCSHR